MRLIVAFTQKDDFHTESVRKSVCSRGGDFIALERERYGADWTITWLRTDAGGQAYLDIGTRAFELKSICACWCRRDFIADALTDPQKPETKYFASQTAIHVNSVLAFMETTTPCMNPPSANSLAASKMLQYAVAQDCGLSVPTTYVGGDPNRADEILNTDLKDKEVCIKAIEATHWWAPDGNAYAHYTSRFRRRPVEELNTLRDCPVILQNLIPKKVEIRATVIGNEIFAASIDTSKASDEAKLDWRRYDWASTPYYRVELPDSVRERLLAVMKRLRLVYGACDLIVTPDDDYVFLEVNSMGQWLWVEELTDLPISDAIARWLMDAR